MKISICGSMAHQELMDSIGETLKAKGYEIETPIAKEAGAYVGEVAADARQKKHYIDAHFAKIDTSDAILVVNEEKKGVANYVGGNTLIEIFHAYSQGLEVFFLNPVPDVSYADELYAVHPIVLDGSIDKIDEYFESLPLVYVSTESQLKQAGVSRAMRRAGIPVRVSGKKVPSGVSEQPMTIEETYEGALNRHQNLKELDIDADYYATVESGLHLVHDSHSMFGCQALVLEKAGEPLRIGIDFDIEFPKDMLDKVPSQYPDIGVLVQTEFGSSAKDPYPFLTGGKVTRQSILENAFYNLIVQEKS